MTLAIAIKGTEGIVLASILCATPLPTRRGIMSKPTSGSRSRPRTAIPNRCEIEPSSRKMWMKDYQIERAERLAREFENKGK
jgi:hypothetical protein